MTPEQNIEASKHVSHLMLKAFKDAIASYDCAIPFDLINWAGAMTYVNLAYSTGTSLEDAKKLVEQIYTFLDNEAKRLPN